MKIYKEIVENTANYTQLQLKFLLNLIEIHTRKDELDRQRNRHGYTYLDKERTKLCFGIQKNISDVAKKMITSIMPKRPNVSSQRCLYLIQSNDSRDFEHPRVHFNRCCTDWLSS